MLMRASRRVCTPDYLQDEGFGRGEVVRLDGASYAEYDIDFSDPRDNAPVVDIHTVQAIDRGPVLKDGFMPLVDMQTSIDWQLIHGTPEIGGTDVQTLHTLEGVLPPGSPAILGRLLGVKISEFQTDYFAAELWHMDRGGCL